MSDLKQNMQRAREFIAENLAECCRDELDWQESSILRDGKLREAAAIFREVDRAHAIPMAQSETARQAMQLARRTQPEATAPAPEFCGRPGTGECSCRKFMDDPTNCERRREEIEAANSVLTPDYSDMSREALERHAARMAQQLANDKPRQFYDKYATGPMLPPSCLCCGKLPDKIAIQHAELPGIVICEECRPRTAPAQDLSAAILALPLPEPELLYQADSEDIHGFTAEQMRDLLKAAAALAYSANALSAGDRVDAITDTQRIDYIESWNEKNTERGLAWNTLAFNAKRPVREQLDELIAVAILQSQKGCSHG